MKVTMKMAAASIRVSLGISISVLIPRALGVSMIAYHSSLNPMYYWGYADKDRQVRVDAFGSHYTHVCDTFVQRLPGYYRIRQMLMQQAQNEHVAQTHDAPTKEAV